jgi:dihydrodipicolinate synthase/N-acetylneuraminate lyase
MITTTLRIHGIVPPVPTPFREDGSVDAGAYHRIARHLKEGGANAAFVLGSTGELPSLSRPRRREAIRAAADAFSGQLPLLVGIGDSCLAETLDLAEAAAAAGAAAVVLSAPSYYEISHGEMRSYLDLLVPRLPLPVMLYNMPWLTGHSFDDATLRHAVTLPGLTGFKDSSGDINYFANLVRIAAARPELTVLIGSDFLFLDALKLGGHGAVAGGANLYPAMFRELLDAFNHGGEAEAAGLQDSIARLGQDIFPITGQPSSVFAAIKGALAALGLCRPDMLPPLTTCAGAELDALRGVLDNAFHPACAVV